MQNTPFSGPMRADDLDDAEARMRQALGNLSARTAASNNHAPMPTRSDGSKPRHQFVRDGQVPTVVLNARREPAAAPDHGAEQALRTERKLREQAEQSLRQAQERIQSLQTQLAHAELAHRDAMAAERREREQAETVLRDMLAEQNTAKARTPRAAAASEIVAPRRRARTDIPADADLTPDTAAVDGDAQPVEWWVPGWRDTLRT